MVKAPRLRNVLVTLLTFLGLTGGAIVSWAGTQDVREIAEKVQEARQSIIEAETEKRKILGSLYSINQRMKKISKEKGHLTDELFHVRDNVKQIAKRIASLEVQIEKQRHQLRRRLRALYKLSGEGFIGVVFSRMSPLELDEVLRFLKIVTDKDHQLIKTYQDNIAVYQVQRRKLKRQVERLIAIEKNIKKNESRLVEEHKSKSKIISNLDRNRQAHLKRMRTLRSKTKGLNDLKQSADEELAALLKPSIFEQKGQLMSPVQGVVIQDFGLITDERYKTQLSHKGWRYLAPKGTPVLSVFDGRILYSASVEGYGHTIVVDHGDHYYSVYAHIARSRVATGDTIVKGQQIAETGPPTRRYGEGMYFEIRHFSEPENPENWISKKGLRISSTQEGAMADVARAEY